MSKRNRVVPWLVLTVLLLAQCAVDWPGRKMVAISALALLALIKEVTPHSFTSDWDELGTAPWLVASMLFVCAVLAGLLVSLFTSRRS